MLDYSLSERMFDMLVRQAFLNAWSVCPVATGVLFHSDRGSQYTSGAFGQTLAAKGFIPSMSGKGNCWNNAVAESFFATLKNEEAVRAKEAETHRLIRCFMASAEWGQDQRSVMTFNLCRGYLKIRI